MRCAKVSLPKEIPGAVDIVPRRQKSKIWGGHRLYGTSIKMQRFDLLALGYLRPGGGAPIIVGLLLLATDSDAVWCNISSSVKNLIHPDDSDYFEALTDDIHFKAKEMGAHALVEWFEDHLSNALQISDRFAVNLVDGNEPAALFSVLNPLFGARFPPSELAELLTAQPVCRL